MVDDRGVMTFLGRGPGRDFVLLALPKTASTSLERTLAPYATEVVSAPPGQKHLPAKLSTLRSALLSWFRPGLTEADADALVAALAKAGRISIDGTKVAYRL